MLLNARSMKGVNPKKGMKSKTRKGRKDFVTHKGDKYFNRRRHRQRGKKGRRPYTKRKSRKKKKRKLTMRGGFNHHNPLVKVGPTTTTTESKRDVTYDSNCDANCQFNQNYQNEQDEKPFFGIPEWDMWTKEFWTLDNKGRTNQM